MAGLLGAGASLQRRYPADAIRASTRAALYACRERGYKDPRWCTFQQAKDKGWKIRKGEHATKVEYWAMYDMERKRWMNWNEVERLKRDDPDAADKLQLRSRTALVFNAAQMEGVPPLPQRPRTDIGQLRQQRDTLLENMQLAYREEGTRAYYSPSADMVTLPPRPASTIRTATSPPSFMSAATPPAILTG